jgi:NAD kinase
MGTLQPRAVLVTRHSEYQELLARHGTRAQAAFFLRSRGQDLEDVHERHLKFEAARQVVSAAIPIQWRRSQIERSHLARFLFEPGDFILALGQDGLVANVAKYLSGQPVVGLNPDPQSNEGVLVRHAPQRTKDLLAALADGRARTEERTMVEVLLDDGQRLLALNEVYLGNKTHQSSRYELSLGGEPERQSSSGVIVTTGTGASGWARSIHRNRVTPVVLPAPEERRLAVFVREAWPSVATGVDLTDGEITEGQELQVVSRMNVDGVVFGDGIEADRLGFDWGRRATIRVADERLRLVS